MDVFELLQNVLVDPFFLEHYLEGLLLNLGCLAL